MLFLADPLVARGALCVLAALAVPARAQDGRAPWPLVGGDFESAVLDAAWSVEGEASTVAGGYLGRRGLELAGGACALRQEIAVGGDASSPRARDLARAAVWYDAAPSARSGVLELSIHSVHDDGTRVLARERVLLAAGEDPPWRWLATDPARTAEIPAGARSLVLELASSGASTLVLDHAELGPAETVHGHARRLALASYVAWYRSPLAEEASGHGSTSRERWQNWSWSAPPTCDPRDASLAHDPDCATNPGCFRANGRRDGAVSTLASLDQLPLAGLYDSRDPDLVRYHVELARAIGLDALVLDWHGKALAEQGALPGEAPIGLGALAELFRAAEAQGAGLKIAVMYEPKVHMSGWVEGETTFAERKAGIVADLAWLGARYASRSAYLHRDGKPVLLVFGQEACTPAGECLDDDDWKEIHAAVAAASGADFYLVATEEPDASDTLFRGFLRWGLVAPSLLRYASWEDFAARREKVPPATESDLVAHARLLASITRSWADAAPGRLAVGIAWPGFDDSGVAGWSVDNGVGSDGGPLCVRVCHDLGGAYLPRTFEVALEDAPEWLHVCTLNDWNEDTAIEPRWSARFFADVRARRDSGEATLEAALGRARATQAGLAAYKAALGVDLDPAEIERVAREYVEDQIAGRATAYD